MAGAARFIAGKVCRGISATSATNRAFYPPPGRKFWKSVAENQPIRVLGFPTISDKCHDPIPLAAESLGVLNVVPLETAKSDEYGHTMHEDCYVLRIWLKEATS